MRIGPSLAITGQQRNAAGIVVPLANWRIPITETYDSAGTDSAFRTAMLGANSSKALPNPTSTNVAAGATRDISFRINEVASPGGVVGLNIQTLGSACFYGSISGNTLTVSSGLTGTLAIGQNVYGFGVLPDTVITGGSGSTWTVDKSQTVAASTVFIASPVKLLVYESFDSVDGSPGSGTWTLNAFSPASSYSGLSYMTAQNQLVQLAAGAARWVRVRLVNGLGTSASLPNNYLVGQLQANGSHDIWASIGMSITTTNTTPAILRALIRTLVPGADPWIVNLQRNGSNYLTMRNEMINPLLNIPQLNGVTNVFYDVGPNDVAYSNIRPWTGKAADIAVGTNFQANLNLLIGKFGANRVYATNISYMNFLTGDGSAGASPYVNNVKNSPNGSLPYNNNYVDSIIKASVKLTSWLDKYDAPLVDDYFGMACSLYNQTYPNDPLHGGNPFWYQRRTAFIQRAYGLAQTYNTPDTIMELIGAKNTSLIKATAVSLMTDCWPATADATAAANRALLTAAANAIETTFADPAVTAPAILPGSVSSATHVLDLDASEFTKFSRGIDGLAGGQTDRVGSYAFTQPNIQGYPLSVTEKADGRKAYINWNTNYGNLFQTTNATLKALLDAANYAFTFYGVMTIFNGGQTGYGSGLFSLGGASNSRLFVNLAGNGRVPRLTTGDGTGESTFSPADAAIVSGTRIAFAFRMDAAGNLKYNRGGVLVTGTTTRLAAITSTANTYVSSTRTGDTNTTCRDWMHHIGLFTGAASDADTANMLAGLREKWSDSAYACI